ncbi:dihydrolipoamide acetyltransferase family protein [Marinicella sp. S1101]|uniref:dihydrolipoamide acetyltransferase family protein n=1 Tax=Marinicella marina TaxID=2996016 RepID=UPI002260ECA8|nr:dihydrolipoamide acetyltransferase family protein [Marinicella marina]MCX7555166.1 dihydrolipoamide acetyltransferase family protein [Marinicella marina]MDJ1141394.1 dihydrolipoamide acetyltransferase family protein [Marinicella marina]
MSIFNLPDLGEGLPDAEIVEWHVKVGDQVEVDQAMVSMETAKAVVDVPVPMAGVVKKLYGEPGDVIDTGAPLIEFSVDGEATADSSEAESEADSPAKLRAEAEQVLMDLDDDSAKQTASPEAPAKEEAIGTVVGQMESSDAVVDSMTDFGGKKAAPAVRALAKKLGVDLSTVEATGTGGVIRPSDVKAAAANPPAQKPASAPAKSAPTQATPNKPAVTQAAKPPAPVNKPIVDDNWQQVKGSRRTMARVMQNSHANIVPTTIMDDADINNWQPGEDITARLIRSLVVAAQAEPTLNAWFDGDKLSRRLISHVDVGIAVDTEDGLFVPTMRNCDQMTAGDVRNAMNNIKEQVKTRSIPPEDMKDYTIMLSNFGVYAGRYATPVITPPCVSIVAAGKLRHDVVPVLGGMEAHRIIPLSLTFDHRAVTGGEAARFLAAMINDLNKSR